MITFPNSKINLGLWVTQRRADGYHNIQTVMFPVPWCDILEIVPATAKGTSLVVTGKQLDAPPENNLCFRAWQLMAENYGIPAVKMHLHKVVPSGAGLGGGSSDASFALKMFNSIFRLGLDNESLRLLAVQLGMDCPFFVENVPSLSSGRGDFLKPVPINLDGFHLLLVKPQIHVSTAAAFAGTRPLYRENSIAEIVSLPIAEWKKELHNDFEDTVFDLYPEIQEIKYRMYRQGAVYSAMSGSGSAVFGLFRGKPVQLDFTGYEVFQSLLGGHP